MTVIQKMTNEILEEVNDMKKSPMVVRMRLRQFAGKCSWMAGVRRRLRWAVAIIFAALADKSGIATRVSADGRGKSSLIEAKRSS